MINKQVVFLSTFYIFFMLQSSAINASDSIRGLMSCTIKGIKIIRINEGRHEEFSRMKGGIELGDKFTIKYENKETSHFSIDIPDFWQPEQVIQSFYIVKDGANVSSIRPSTYNPEGFIQLTDKHKFQSITWNYNEIIAQDFFGHKSLTIERYFKNDWNGIYVFNLGLNSENITFDCRHTLNQLEDIKYKIIPKIKKSD